MKPISLFFSGGGGGPRKGPPPSREEEGSSTNWLSTHSLDQCAAAAASTPGIDRARGSKNSPQS